MATLISTFSRIDASYNYNPPVAMGTGCRTEAITMPDTGDLAAEDELIIELLADADCWVAIGDTPDADSTDRRKIKAGIPYAFGVRRGDKVAVKAA